MNVIVIAISLVCLVNVRCEPNAFRKRPIAAKKHRNHFFFASRARVCVCVCLAFTRLAACFIHRDLHRCVAAARHRYPRPKTATTDELGESERTLVRHHFARPFVCLCLQWSCVLCRQRCQIECLINVYWIVSHAPHTQAHTAARQIRLPNIVAPVGWWGCCIRCIAWPKHYNGSQTQRTLDGASRVYCIALIQFCLLRPNNPLVAFILAYCSADTVNERAVPPAEVVHSKAA